MEPGGMRRRVEIQSPPDPTNKDAYGQPVQTWTTLATVWARIKPVGGRERLNAEQTKSTVTHRVWIRWSGTTKAVTAAYRLLYESRILNIDYVITLDEARRTLELGCVEQTLPALPT